MSRRQLAVYSRRALQRKAIEVEGRKDGVQEAAGLCREGEAEEGEEKEGGVGRRLRNLTTKEKSKDPLQQQTQAKNTSKLGEFQSPRARNKKVKVRGLPNFAI